MELLKLMRHGQMLMVLRVVTIMTIIMVVLTINVYRKQYRDLLLADILLQ